MENNVNIQPSFQFVDYIIQEAHIEISDKEISHNMRFEINPNGEIDKNNKRFILSLKVIVYDAEDKFKVSFLIKGIFEYKCTDFEQLINFIGVNSPAILFPYIRAYVSSITGLSGMPPVIMPTLNMQPIGEELIKKLKNSEA